VLRLFEEALAAGDLDEAFSLKKRPKACYLFKARSIRDASLTNMNLESSLEHI